MIRDRQRLNSSAWLIAFALISLIPSSGVAQENSEGNKSLAPLRSPPSLNAAKVELGKLLFFDPRLSGDATVSCSTCHQPDKAWTDGLALSQGYPGTLYFRNTPTVANVVHSRYVYWDGRLPAADLPTVVRDHISEAHFMQADGRLVIERMRQVSEYEQRFQEIFDGEPTYGRILDVVAEFVKSLVSTNVPLDQHLAGEDALTEQQLSGLELFRGKAGCIECHHGPMLSDHQHHGLGVPTNDDIFASPERHITMRRFLRTLGVSEYAKVRRDVGRFCVTKQPDDVGLFRTPTLREVSRTAPYMHGGTLATLEDVIAFYNQGCGKDEDGNPLRAPLGLNDEESAALVAFLKSLSGDLPEIEPPELPPYGLRTIGEN